MRCMYNLWGEQALAKLAGTLILSTPNALTGTRGSKSTATHGGCTKAKMRERTDTGKTAATRTTTTTVMAATRQVFGAGTYLECVANHVLPIVHSLPSVSSCRRSKHFRNWYGMVWYGMATCYGMVDVSGGWLAADVFRTYQSERVLCFFFFLLVHCFFFDWSVNTPFHNNLSFFFAKVGEPVFRWALLCKRGGKPESQHGPRPHETQT